MITPDYDQFLKLLVIGDTGVGKSSLLRRFTDNVFHDEIYSTIAVDVKTKTIQIGDSLVKLHISDTAGHERFKAITPSYYKGAHGIIMIYDITNRESFESINNFWLPQIEQYGSDDVTKIIIGNKSDLIPHMRRVDVKTVKEFAETLKVAFFETSAKNGTNVEEAFEAIAREILFKKMGNGHDLKKNGNYNNNNNNNGEMNAAFKIERSVIDDDDPAVNNSHKCCS